MREDFRKRAKSGLAQSWRGCRVFMNPPYGSEIGAWVEKAARTASGRPVQRTEANDPNGTHDFLKFELSNRSFIFSIVAYDKNLEFESPDPADPDKTILVGTLMQNSDW